MAQGALDRAFLILSKIKQGCLLRAARGSHCNRSQYTLPMLQGPLTEVGGQTADTLAQVSDLVLEAYTIFTSMGHANCVALRRVFPGAGLSKPEPTGCYGVQASIFCLNTIMQNCFHRALAV